MRPGTGRLQADAVQKRALSPPIIVPHLHRLCFLICGRLLPYLTFSTGIQAKSGLFPRNMLSPEPTSQSQA